MNPLIRWLSPDEKSPPPDKKQRIWIILVLLGLGWVILWARTFQVQVLKAKEYREEMANSTGKVMVLAPPRGQIFDRNGELLAGIRPYTAISTEAKVFKKGYEVMRRLPNGSKVKVKLDKDSIRIDTTRTTRFARTYPWGKLAGSLLGRVNPQGHGILGIEKSLDTMLYGRDGWTTWLKYSDGKVRSSRTGNGNEPIPGKDVYLTIDRRIQEICENILETFAPKISAKRVTALVVEAKNGEILAMANYPFDDPSSSTYTHEGAHVGAVSTSYEPGSIVKLLTAAASIDTKSIRPYQYFNTFGGHWKPSNSPKAITDHEPPFKNILTLGESFAISSNVVFAQIGIQAGERNIFRYFRNFGLGMQTGIELPGELPGLLKEINNWSATTLQTISYGYEIKATPLQMAMAYAAVANNGTLMRPKLVRGWRDPITDTFAMDTLGRKVRQVISPETSHLLQKLAREVVDNEHGTAHSNHSKLISFAGKTGTATIWDSITRNYNGNKNNASFAGWIPAENPRFAIMILVEEPSYQFRYGGASAGVIFRDIAEKLILTPGIMSSPRIKSNAGDRISMPELRGSTLSQGQSLARKNAWALFLTGEGNQILAQEPTAQSAVARGDSVRFWLYNPSAPKTPDFSMMFAGNACKAAQKLKLKCKWTGLGRVQSQNPAPGSPLPAPGQSIHLQLGQP